MILCLFEIKLEGWCQKDFYQPKNAIKLSINTQKNEFPFSYSSDDKGFAKGTSCS